jgi:hypothetical protein
MLPKNTTNKLINSHMQCYSNNIEVSWEYFYEIIKEYSEDDKNSLFDRLWNGEHIIINNNKLYFDVVVDI